MITRAFWQGAFEVPGGRQIAHALVVTVAGLAVANCSSGSKLSSKVDPKYGVSASPRVVEPGQPVPKGGGTYRVGKPYVVAGRVYVPEENVSYRAEGIASWYGSDFHGRLTANGEVYDMHGISAAHPTLPMPSYARVTNVANGRSVVVRINDRGPYHSNRLIDLSGKTAELLGFRGHGLARVRVEYVGRAPLEGSDDRRLLATYREGSPAPAPSTVMVASARPFLPTSDRPTVRGPVPVPPERPYDLGQDQDGGTSADGPAPLRSAARLPVAATPTSGMLAPPAAPARVSPALGITSSGRGLY